MEDTWNIPTKNPQKTALLLKQEEDIPVLFNSILEQIIKTVQEEKQLCGHKNILKNVDDTDEVGKSSQNISNCFYT